MSVNTRKGPIFDPGLCRCCGAIKKCRILNVEYEWNGQKEVYSDMFMDCFGLLLSHLDGEAAGRLVCATCVCRLREALSFREQVLRCEERLLTRMHGAEGESDVVKLEPLVKEELANASMEVECHEYGDAADHIGNDIEDDELLEAKKPKRKSLRQKLKRNKKSKTKETDSTDAADLSHPNREEILGDFQEYSISELQAPVHRKQNGCRTESSKLNQNALTIVEYSYVCPFDTSFSDYFCVYCRQVFTEPNDLREHTITHDPRTFKDVLTNTMNDKKIQLDIYRIDCRLCPEQINDLEHFQRHITTHGIILTLEKDAYLKFKLTSGTLKCTECDSTFGFFHALRKHMHFGSCICDVCGAHYFTARMLALHQRTHRRATRDATYPCRECAKCFKSSYTRHIHVARTHRKEAAYQCSSCDESFFSYALRYRHMCAAHGRQRTFRCDACPRAYDSRKSLREHTRRAHLDIRKHQCDLCDKRFYLPSRLKEHMASHTGERNFRCERCGKSYPRLRALTVHLQTHAHARRPRVDSGACHE